MTRSEIAAVLARYLAAHPDRADDVAPLAEALADDTDLSSRSTFPLPVTASAAVIDTSIDTSIDTAIDTVGRVLLIRHRALDRWLLPGGHVEPEDRSLYGAALRELEEETGIPWQRAVPPPAHDVAPVDIDVHEIPANPAKGEPAHLHADFRYAFWAKETPITIQAEEVTAFAWRPLSDLPTTRLTASVAAI